MKVGITGHQNLGGGDAVAWLRETIRTVVEETSVSEGFTCLAKGADQLYAEILLEKLLPYTVVLPCEEYETTFGLPEDLANFRRLHDKAVHIIKMPFREPSEVAYLHAGQFIADNSDLLIAIWNGLPAKGLGGTGDIVKYAIAKNKATLHINPVTQTATKLKRLPPLE